jgi:hypothetical protein
VPYFFTSCSVRIVTAIVAKINGSTGRKCGGKENTFKNFAKLLKICNMKVTASVGIFLVSACLLFTSCKKETKDVVRDTVQVGTVWTLQYKTFSASGVLSTTSTIRWRAQTEETLGSDKWLKIVDSTGALVFYLKLKTDGLYQYANNAPQLLCKSPAAVNDAYTSYNETANEDFLVTHTNLLLDLPFFNATVNRYTGSRSGNVNDILWFNKDLWLAKLEKYTLNSFTGVWHIDKRWEVTGIQY